MAQGPAIPDKSVMLDYLSPTLPSAMYRSLKNRHFVVFGTITVFIAIKIIMIVSTGLLLLENVLGNAIPTKLLVANEFDASKFSNSSTARSHAALTVHGILENNLPFPIGTTSDYAFQSFESTANSSASPSAILNGTVDYFTADIDCEVGDVSHTVALWPIDHLYEVYYNTSLPTATCLVSSVPMQASFSSSEATNQSAGYSALLQPVNCTGADSGRGGDPRLMITINYSQYTNASYYNETGIDKTMINATGILCKPRYGIGRAIVIQNTTNSNQSFVDILPMVERSHQLAGLSSWDVAEGVLSAMQYPRPGDGGNRVGDTPIAVDFHNENVSADAFSALFISASPDVPFYTYMDPQSLITASQRTFKFLAAQMAHQNLMLPAQNVVEGSYSDRVDRIMVQELPLRVMQGMIAAAALTTIFVGLLMPRCALPGSANTIGFYISICGKGQPAIKPLEGSDVCTMDRMRQILSSYRFHTDFDKVGEPPEVRINSTISPAERSHLSGLQKL
jgi:Protein of unknown function (DUF3433)